MTSRTTSLIVAVLLAIVPLTAALAEGPAETTLGPACTAGGALTQSVSNIAADGVGIAANASGEDSLEEDEQTVRDQGAAARAELSGTCVAGAQMADGALDEVSGAADDALDSAEEAIGAAEDFVEDEVPDVPDDPPDVPDDPEDAQTAVEDARNDDLRDLHHMDPVDGTRTPRIWTSENDGTGSTLNADLLDNLSSQDFLHRVGDQTLEGDLLHTGDLRQTGDLHLKDPEIPTDFGTQIERTERALRLTPGILELGYTDSNGQPAPWGGVRFKMGEFYDPYDLTLERYSSLCCADMKIDGSLAVDYDVKIQEELEVADDVYIGSTLSLVDDLDGHGSGARICIQRVSACIAGEDFSSSYRYPDGEGIRIGDDVFIDGSLKVKGAVEEIEPLHTTYLEADTVAADDVVTENLRIDNDADNQEIYFDPSGDSERLRWTGNSDLFEFSDDLLVNGVSASSGPLLAGRLADVPTIYFGDANSWIKKSYTDWCTTSFYFPTLGDCVKEDTLFINNRVAADLLTAEVSWTRGLYSHGASIEDVTLGALEVLGDKLFVHPHPTDPTQKVRYVAQEGPQHGIQWQGQGQLQDGHAVVELPAEFSMVLSPDAPIIASVTLTAQANGVYIKEKTTEHIVVEELLDGRSDATFDIVVHGTRNGFEDFDVVVPMDTPPSAYRVDGVLPDPPLYEEMMDHYGFDFQEEDLEELGQKQLPLGQSLPPELD